MEPRGTKRAASMMHDDVNEDVQAQADEAIQDEHIARSWFRTGVAREFSAHGDDSSLVVRVLFALVQLLVSKVALEKARTRGQETIRECCSTGSCTSYEIAVAANVAVRRWEHTVAKRERRLEEVQQALQELQDKQRTEAINSLVTIAHNQ